MKSIVFFIFTLLNAIPLTVNAGDMLTLIVDARHNLPIGYGETWKCPVRSVVTGELADKEISLSTIGPFGEGGMYGGYFENFGTHEALEITFKRLGERPAALSGFAASDGTIWEIFLVRSAKYKLPWAFEGRYEVSWVTDATGGVIAKTGIGELILKKGDYAFNPTANRVIPEDAVKRLPFIEEPGGYYDIEYYGGIGDGEVLSEAGDDDILATVTFVCEDGETIGDLLIRNDNESKGLYLSSTVSEFEIWTIKKGWEE